MKKILRAVLVLVLAFPLMAAAEGYPDRPVKIIAPYTSGGPVDQLARELANGWSRALGQSFIVESKPGANAALGTAFVASSAPNGYTLLIGAGGGNIAVPALSARPPYDGIKEFAPVMMALFISNVLVPGTHMTAANLQQFIELAQAKPKGLSIASAGTGGATHIAGEIFQLEAKVKLTHVPYKGAAPIVNDLLGGHVDSACLNVSAILPHVRAGRLRALAVAARTRSKALPDVPTFAEQGIQDFSGSWYAVLAPAGTPPEIVQALYTAAASHLSQPDVQARLEASGQEVFLLDPPRLLAFMLEEKRDLIKIIKATGLTIDQ